MARHRARTCPKCGDYLGVAVSTPSDYKHKSLVDVPCLRCGFKPAWRVIQDTKRKAATVVRATLLAFALVFFASASPLRAAVCPHNQVSKADLQKFDSALPIHGADKIQAEITHLPWGFPGTKRLLYHREFSISYDTDRRVPLWVAYKLRAGVR